MATKKYSHINELIQGSYTVKPNTRVSYPYSGIVSLLDTSFVMDHNNAYALNNGTIAFIVENELHVTPFTRAALAFLQENGFRHQYFYVPFSNGDYPNNEMHRWESLKEMAKKEREEEFSEDCLLYSKEHDIGELSAYILSKCMEIPKTGIRVKHMYYESTYYPHLDTSSFDCTTSDYLGKYYLNNGRVTFVYRDGRSFVTKNCEIISALRQAGYTERNLYVPLSNGEQILDPAYRSLWNSL